MIANTIFFLGLLSGVVNSRSVIEKRKLYNAPYVFIPLGQIPLATLIGFLGGPIAISTIVIWGFFSLNAQMTRRPYTAVKMKGYN